MNTKQATNIIGKIEEIQSVMVAYVTGQRSDEQPAQYRRLYEDLFFELEKEKYENPNPHKSLETFWSHCRLQQMGTWADRRAYVQGLYEDILLDLKRIQRNDPEPKNWKKANEVLTDKLTPVRRQWLKANNFIYQNPPDYENSIKEAINSIESALMILLNRPNDSLGKLIKNPNLDSDISKLISQAYGLTSNKDFVRHGGMENENINEHDAHFFLEFAAISIIYIRDKLKDIKP